MKKNKERRVRILSSNREITVTMTGNNEWKDTSTGVLYRMSELKFMK